LISHRSKLMGAAAGLLTFAGIAGLLLFAARADARASIAHSSPARNYIFDRSVTEQVPERVTITFTEPVAASGYSIRVRDDNNLSITTGSTRIAADDPHTMLIDLRPGYSAADTRDTAAYHVQWTVRSTADNATSAGSFKFCYGEHGFTLCDGGHVHPPGTPRGTAEPERDLGEIPPSETPAATLTPSPTPTATIAPTETATPPSTVEPVPTSTPSPQSTVAGVAAPPEETAAGRALGEAVPLGVVYPPNTGAPGGPSSQTSTRSAILASGAAAMLTALGTLLVRTGLRKRVPLS
jgi:methionine-rich copper-binding protein CopC